MIVKFNEQELARIEQAAVQLVLQKQFQAAVEARAEAIGKEITPGITAEELIKLYVHPTAGVMVPKTKTLLVPG